MIQSRFKKASYSRYILWGIVTCLFICMLMFYIQFLQDILSSRIKHIKPKQQRQKAVVYALPTFHDEVVSSVCCILHSLGYHVIVYIGSGYHIGSFTIPFSGQRQRKSQDFYGRCVSEWVTIKPGMKIETDIDMIVFVTYPMLKAEYVFDDYAISYLKAIQRSENDRRSKGSTIILPHNPHDVNQQQHQHHRVHAVYIGHRADELVHPMYMIRDINEQYIPRNQSIYLTVSEHTYKSAQLEFIQHHDELNSKHHSYNKKNRNSKSNDVINQQQTSHSVRNNNLHNSHSRSRSNDQQQYSPNDDNSPIRLSYFYPILPPGYIASDSLSTVSSSNLQYDKRYKPTFVMQGRFGGRHAHRKDPLAIVQCLQKLDLLYQQQQKDQELLLLQQQQQRDLRSTGLISNSASRSGDDDDYYEDGVVTTDYENIDRNTTDNATTAAAYRQTMSIQRDINHDTLSSLSASSSSSSAQRNSIIMMAKQNSPLSLDIVGRQLEILPLPTHLPSGGRIRVLSDLWYIDYYKTLSRGKFMLLGLAEKEYYSTRATSSVPAALIAQVPLVATREFLALYPCLRNAPIHSQLIARDTECDSIHAALTLTPAEYSQAKQEIINCSIYLWTQAQQVFQSITTPTLTSSSSSGINYN